MTVLLCCAGMRWLGEHTEECEEIGTEVTLGEIESDEIQDTIDDLAAAEVEGMTCSNVTEICNREVCCRD